MRIVIALILFMTAAFPRLGMSSSSDEVTIYDFGRNYPKGIIISEERDLNLKKMYRIGFFNGNRSRQVQNISKAEYKYIKKGFADVTGDQLSDDGNSCASAIRVSTNGRMTCYQLDDKKKKGLSEWYKMVEEFVWMKKSTARE